MTWPENRSHCSRRSIRAQKRRQRALFARMDRAVHQSGMPSPRTLVTRRCRTGGALQQLRGTASQRAPAPEPAAQAKATSADDLPAQAARLLASSCAVWLRFSPRNCLCGSRGSHSELKIAIDLLDETRWGGRWTRRVRHAQPVAGGLHSCLFRTRLHFEFGTIASRSAAGVGSGC